MRLFFSVGEPSGDLHGGNLIRRLKQSGRDCECVGYGGPRMQDAGCKLHADLTQHAVMGVSRAIASVPRMWNYYRQADRWFQDHPVDGVVLIDFPGFNWWIAKAAKRRGIPVFYYGVPQLWAWAPWRVRKMRRFVDHALCKLPFEVDWYRKRGCQATFVGHPYFDELRQRKLDQDFLAKYQNPSAPLVTMLPGSRDQEVEHLMPWFFAAGRRLREQCGDVRFAMACYKPQHQQLARQLAREQDFPVDVHVDRTAELIHAAHSCLACSGSVSLELMYHAKPTVIVYRVKRPMYWTIRVMKTVRYITLVNLFASKDPFGRGKIVDHVPFPEFLTYQDPAEDVSRTLADWIERPLQHQQIVRQLEDLRGQFVQTGASEQAAQYILEKTSTPLAAVDKVRRGA